MPNRYKKSYVSETAGLTLPGIPAPFGFNPIAIPSLREILYDKLMDELVDFILEGAISALFDEATQTHVNNTIENLLRQNGGWSYRPINPGECE